MSEKGLAPGKAMNMLFWKRKQVPEVGGAISSFGLTDWWLIALSSEEREYIERRYQPALLGQGRSSLTTGNASYVSGTPAQLLTSIAGWLRTAHERDLQRRVLLHALEVPGTDWNRHFTYIALIENYYRDRDNDPRALAETIRYCELDVALAPGLLPQWYRMYPTDKQEEIPAPTHPGFKRLAIIRQKQGDLSGAIALCEQAREQGWSGDWDERIQRLKARLEKTKSMRSS